jgi:alpha-tubulin suppressor-like RCC1 family protein
MIRIRLHESTRLDLSQFDKDQLSLLCRRENHSSFLSAGENHSLVLDSKGRVFSFGHNDEYQLGFPDKVSREYPALMREIENDPIKAVSAGHRHSLILNSQGWVFSFGNNLSGQLGIEEYQDGSVPALIDLPDKEEIVAIAAGERHSLVLNSQGQVFSFGANELGQLGLGGNEDRFTPTLIEDPELGIVVAIAAGGNHSLLLNSQGQVFSCGAGAGETYDPDRDDDEILFTPYLINTSETGEIIALSTGHNHSLLLNSQGQVFGFGNNEDGQLGIRDYHIGYTPILIETLGTDKIIAISAGGAHSLFLNSEGQVFSCGLNEYRQLGFKDRDNQIIPTLIGTLGIGKIIAISAGKNYSLFSNSRGRVFGSGCNSYGKLGSSDRNFRTTPTLIRGLVI